jgi:Family of unknown function (DUF5990)
MTSAISHRPAHVRLCIICEVPPSVTYAGQPAEFGLQDTRQNLHAGVAQPDGSLRFLCEVSVKPSQAGHAPDFGGPFVHGPRGARFLYLGLRDADSAWIRRLKVPLAGITWEQVADTNLLPSGALVARVSGAGSGTVPLLGDKWVVSEQELRR